MWASALMAFSSVSVVLNSLRLAWHHPYSGV
jgi:cation transport ATPase